MTRFDHAYFDQALYDANMELEERELKLAPYSYGTEKVWVIEE